MLLLEKALANCIRKSEIYKSELRDGDIREYLSQYDGQYLKGVKEEYRTLGHIFSWTQSFYTGMGYWAYKVTKDESYLSWLNSYHDNYYDKVFKTPLETMHDLGFLYSPYAVALYKSTNDSNMKKIGIKAADEFVKRFDPKGGYIRAWGRMDDKIPEYVDSQLAKDHFFTNSRGLAIIDCMMNIPLLFWASEVTGHPFYKTVAMIHADTTLKYFLREDGSLFHAYRFDEESGEPIGGCNFCGYSDDSFWARGTTWAIYGFVIAYGYTGKQEYLDTSVKLAKTFINNCEEDGIPLWDFTLPTETPAIYCGNKGNWMEWDITDPKNTVYNRDTSAAAVAASAFYEILKYKEDSEIRTAMDKMLESLANNYMNNDVSVPGILRCQNGRNIYSIIGDYYYMEALAKRLHGFENIW